MDIKMYIVVNADLKMSPGKIASQVGHIVQRLTEDLVSSGYEDIKPSDNYIKYCKWKTNCTKVILQASNKKMMKLKELPNCVSFIDDGLTEIPKNSLTVIGFYPCYTNEVDKKITQLKLL